MKLRKATTSDIELLRYWDNLPHIIASKGNEDWEWERELPQSPEWREQYIIELNNKPIGFLQIIDPHLEETHYWGEVSEGLRAIDIWIGETEYLGKGLGSEATAKAIDKCFEDPRVEAILVDPLSNNKRAHRFYEKFGFEFLEPRKFCEDDCFVFKLRRANYRKR